MIRLEFGGCLRKTHNDCIDGTSHNTHEDTRQQETNQKAEAE